MTIYIANLENAINNEKLTELFSPFGEVKSAEVVMDVFTGASRGFGYVQMEDDAAQTAIDQLDQTELNTLIITVRQAPPKKEPQGSYKVGQGAVNNFRFKKN